LKIKDIRNTQHSALSNDPDVTERQQRLINGRDAKSTKSGDQNTKAYAVSDLPTNNIQSGYKADNEVQAAHHDMLGACLPGDPRADQTESKVKQMAALRKMIYDHYLWQPGGANKYEVARRAACDLRREGEEKILRAEADCNRCAAAVWWPAQNVCLTNRREGRTRRSARGSSRRGSRT